MWARLTEFHWLTLHSLAVLTGLVIYVIASHTLHQRRHPAAAVAWIISLVLVPYVALPLYMLFGSRKLVAYAPPPGVRAGTRMQAGAAPKLPADASTEASPKAPASGVQQLAAALGLPPPSGYEALHIHANGHAAWAALLAGIESANETLEVCTFILGRDALGERVMQALIARARAGVRVRLLIDGIGLFMGGRPTLKHLKQAGVQVALFVPPLHSPLRGRTNLRNHRKMAIADGRWFWCGGRNLAAEYFEGSNGAPPWTDLSFDLTGPLAAQARDRFEIDWDFAVNPRTSAAAPLSSASGTQGGPPAQPVPGGPLAQLMPSGPDQGDDTVYTVLVSAIFAARERVLIATPYFVPDPTLMMALTLAARRGVAVDLLLPAASNHRMADIARHRALRDLAAAGGCIWLYPRMLHAKAVVIDSELALAGTANLDARSLFLNYELMVAFYETGDVTRFVQWIEAQRQLAVPYAAKRAGLLREIGEGLVLWVAFQL